MRIEKSNMAFAEIATGICADANLWRLVENARNVLEVETHASFNLIKEYWDMSYDEYGRPSIRLRLTDPWGEAETVFALWELENIDALTRIMHHLWGDVLSSATKSLIKSLREQSPQPVGG